MSHEDQEFKAIQTIYNILEPLGPDARRRVIKYIVSRLDVSGSSTLDAAEIDSSSSDLPVARKSFASFAELFEEMDPKTNAEKALAAGYWLQVCNGADSFDSQSANKELKHLGEGLANVTAALEALKEMKPALALQLKKSGKSQQARKTYKITTAGEKRALEMIASAD